MILFNNGKRKLFSDKIRNLDNENKSAWTIINNISDKARENTKNIVSSSHYAADEFIASWSPSVHLISAEESTIIRFVAAYNLPRNQFRPQRPKICSSNNPPKTNKDSSGYDKMSNHLIKSEILIIYRNIIPLIHIVNNSLATSVFPEKLKHARVISIFEKMISPSIEISGPISLLPCFSKILESVMSKRIITL